MAQVAERPEMGGAVNVGLGRLAPLVGKAAAQLCRGHDADIIVLVQRRLAAVLLLELL